MTEGTRIFKRAERGSPRAKLAKRKAYLLQQALDGLAIVETALAAASVNREGAGPALSDGAEIGLRRELEVALRGSDGERFVTKLRRLRDRRAWIAGIEFVD